MKAQPSRPYRYVVTVTREAYNDSGRVVGRARYEIEDWESLRAALDALEKQCAQWGWLDTEADK